MLSQESGIAKGVNSIKQKLNFVRLRADSRTIRGDGFFLEIYILNGEGQEKQKNSTQKYWHYYRLMAHQKQQERRHKKTGLSA
jgi:hypothetical protein